MKLKIQLDGRTYEVEVEATEPETRPSAQFAAAALRAPAPVIAAPPAPGGGEAVADESKVCRSPISGTVVRVNASAGQAMQVGDVLLVLEAMKMETNITAPAAAKISTVKAAAGDAVRTGQVVVEFA